MGSPPNIGGNISGSVVSVSPPLVTGDLNDISGNIWADTWSIQTGAAYGTASINPTTGAWTYTLNASHPAVLALNPGDILTDTFLVRLTDTLGADTQVVTITITGIPCFVSGTRIETARGMRPVETLEPGDLVETLDHGLQALRWIGRTQVGRETMALTPEKRPVRIAKGAFGNGLPKADLLVSRQHRILVTSPVIRRLTGSSQALVPAHRLLDLPGITLDLPDRDIDYVHILFDQHQIVFSEGIASESLLLGRESRKSLSESSLAEIRKVFPSKHEQARLSRPARDIPSAKIQKQIVRETFEILPWQKAYPTFHNPPDFDRTAFHPVKMARIIHFPKLP